MLRWTNSPLLLFLLPPPRPYLFPLLPSRRLLSSISPRQPSAVRPPANRSSALRPPALRPPRAAKRHPSARTDAVVVAELGSAAVAVVVVAAELVAVVDAVSLQTGWAVRGVVRVCP